MSGDPFDESLREFRRARWRSRFRVVLIALAVVALLGLLPLAFGAGYFGWRLFRYDRVSLHVVNVTGETVTLSLGGVTEALESGRVHQVGFRAGEVVLEARGEDGRQLDRQTFTSDNQSVFYHLGSEGCYVLLETSAMYNPGRREAPLQVVQRIYPEDRITLLPPGVFIPPRGVMPDQVPGGQRVWWIDDVACELLDPDEEHVLIAQQMVRMEARREERQRLREEHQRRQEEPRR